MAKLVTLLIFAIATIKVTLSCSLPTTTAAPQLFHLGSSEDTQIHCSVRDDCDKKIQDALCVDGLCRCTIGKASNGTACVVVHCEKRDDCFPEGQGLHDERYNVVVCDVENRNCTCFPGYHLKMDASKCVPDIGQILMLIIFVIFLIVVALAVLCCCFLCGCYICKQVYEEHRRGKVLKEMLHSAKVKSAKVGKSTRMSNGGKQ